MEKLMTLLIKIRPDLDFEKEDNLMDERIIDSFDIITIVGEINETFGITINAIDLLDAKNFNSAKTIWALIQKYTG
jgi:acyl carrier protein